MRWIVAVAGSLAVGTMGALALEAVGEDWIIRLGGTLERGPRGEVVALSFRSSWIEDSDLQPVARIGSLRRLDLSHTRVTDVGFQQLKNMPAMEEVNLYFAEQIGDGALVVMKNWKRLKRVNLRGTKVTDLGLAQLAGHPSLESLDVGYSLFTDNGFEPLTAIPNLKEIAVGGNKLTDVGVNVLRLAPALTALDLSGVQRTDSGLWAAIITDRGLETIGQLKNLRRLNLRGAKITDAGMEKLGGLSELTEADFGQTNLTAAGLQPLVGLTKLEKLTLYRCARLNDDAVAFLTQMKGLKWLDIEATGITEAGVAKLRAALPALRIAR
ncbi:MAG: hypothetical protein NZV14_02415 [Bryobacteraceae bacterium]|nr:hypothetical protein [Bryobacteraceae bacterium]MDW8376985.1 hypothetical protein [Bryobacterales bacterium]